MPPTERFSSKYCGDVCEIGPLLIFLVIAVDPANGVLIKSEQREAKARRKKN